MSVIGQEIRWRMKAVRDWDFWITMGLFAFMFGFPLWLRLPIRTSSVQPPPYSAPVKILGENREWVGFANAFLVDRELGLLVTNAHVAVHVVDERNELQVRFGSRFYSVRTQESWINRSADVAIIRLVKYHPEELPLAAELSSSVYVGLLVQARGYKMNGENFCAESAVTELMENEIIVQGGWQSWLTRNTIRPGCSGSAVLGRNGKVVGIVSATALMYWYNIFISSREIEKLLKQVQFSFQRPVASSGRFSLCYN